MIYVKTCFLQYSLYENLVIGAPSPKRPNVDSEIDEKQNMETSLRKNEPRSLGAKKLSKTGSLNHLKTMKILILTPS